MAQTNFTYNGELSAHEVPVHDLIQKLLIVLSDKEKYIIQNRFALEQRAKQTLEQIGQHFGVTRERVRQIERSALRKLERNAQNTNIKILSEFAKALLEKEGGLVQDEHFKTMLINILPNISAEVLHDLHLALVLDPNIEFQGNTLQYDPYWSTKTISTQEVKTNAQSITKTLKKARRVMSLDEVLKTSGIKLSPELAKNIIMITKACKLTNEGVGLYSWRHIHPRTLRDKINFTLKKERRPMHFNKIAKSIQKANFDNKTVNTQAIHNELIRNENFILIGRGIYALKEWGYKTGTVADIIEDILSDGTALSREEITKAVLEQRHVKTITIYLNLKNKEQFVRVGRDKYTLAKFNK